MHFFPLRSPWPVRGEFLLHNAYFILFLLQGNLIYLECCSVYARMHVNWSPEDSVEKLLVSLKDKVGLLHQLHNECFLNFFLGMFFPFFFYRKNSVAGFDCYQVVG